MCYISMNKVQFINSNFYYPIPNDFFDGNYKECWEGTTFTVVIAFPYKDNLPGKSLFIFKEGIRN